VDYLTTSQEDKVRAQALALFLSIEPGMESACR